MSDYPPTGLDDEAWQKYQNEIAQYEKYEE